MTVYYLIVGKAITREINTANTDVTALPLLDRVHIIALMNRLELTAAEVIESMGLVDERNGEE